MPNLDLKHADPRSIARVADFVARTSPATAAAIEGYGRDAGVGATFGGGGPHVIPGRGPVSMPVAQPGPPGYGGLNRYREMTLEEMLLENRVVFLVGEINHVTASRVIMQMLYLQSVKKDQDINFYINSPGGVVDDTLAMYDIMKFLTCDIATYCIGRAESGGAIVFAAGKKGKRYILPNAKVMIHQPFGGVYGQAADIEIQAEEIIKTKEVLINILAKCTGQTPDRIKEDSERDRFFDAKAAVKYGLADEILGEDAPTSVTEAAVDGTKPK